MRLRAALNGSPWSVEVEPTASLLDVLRAEGLTGTKEGCRIGVCGVCTVLVDDLPASSCLYLAACAEGREIWTVEGVALRSPEVVDAFVDCEGMQCGICTPGQVVTVASIGPDVDGEDGLRGYLAGNLCRCTGYSAIVEAAAAARVGREAP